MDDTVPIAGIAAFCAGNFGIGKNGGLPWPYLKEDHEFYTGLCRNTKDPDKKNGIITGTNGWKHWSIETKTHPKYCTVVTSSSLAKDEPHCLAVARDFDEAIEIFNKSPNNEQLETIYILGGRLNYEHAVSDPRVKRLYMTRVYQDFDCDVFFPQFEHAFHRVSHPDIDDTIREDPATGIKFRFEVWDKNSS